jgi:hypothetical protein
MSSCKTTQHVQQATPKTTIEVITSPVLKSDTLISKTEAQLPSTLMLGFVMPFYFESNLNPAEGEEIKKLEPQSLSSISFMQGALLALDSFKNENLNIHFSAFDLADTATVTGLIKDKNLSLCDFVFISNQAPLSDLLNHNHNMKFFCIQPTMLMHNNLMACQPNNQTMIKELALFLAKKNLPVSIIYRNQKKEKELALWMQKEIDTALTDFNYKTKTLMLDYTSLKTQLLTKLDKTKNNLIVIASNDEAFLAPIIHELASENSIKIQLFGLPTWENFESLNFNDLQKLNTVIFNNSFVDYNDTETNTLRKSFIKKYNADLTFQTLQGFYLIKSIMQNHSNIKTEWSHKKLTEIFNNQLFYINMSSPFNGYYNSTTFFLKFSNFSLQKQ